MPATIENRILEKLNKVEKEEGKLPLLFDFYRQLIDIYSRTKQQIKPPEMDKAAIGKRLRSKRPMLRFEELKLDGVLLRKVFTEVTAAFAGYPELFGPVPDSLKTLRMTKAAARAWYNGTSLPESFLKDGRNKTLLNALIHATLKPFLEKSAAALNGLVDQEKWRRRYCPVCGGSPDFAFLDSEKTSRWLFCSRCDAEWLFQRLECPYCGNVDHKTLAYFTDDKGRYRLYVCEKCRHYIKAIDLRQTGDDILLPLERLETFDLDAQARQQGYRSYEPDAG